MRDTILCVSKKTNIRHTWKYNLRKAQQNKKIISHLFKKLFDWNVIVSAD